MKPTLKGAIPRMNQLALIHDLKLSNLRHFKLILTLMKK